MTDSEEKPLRVRAADLATREFDGQTIVLDLRSSAYLSLNRSATFLWRRLQGGSNRKELLHALRAEFEIDADLAERDVDRFLTECRRRDLLAP
jgi:Coenzyme PQQ synthesis protein D (PqqD)